MKIKTLFAIFMAFSCASYGQHVGIGTSSPAALLDVSATDDGILIPRVALTGSNTASPLTSPAVSTLVYNTATAGSSPYAVVPGFYYWNGSAWILFVDNSALTENTSVSNTSSANTLSTTVNGTTGDTVPIINTNALSQNGTGQLISTINGIGSTPYTVGMTGDVTGSLGAAAVSGIQGTPVTVSSLADGDLLQYNTAGTDWVNVNPAAILSAVTTHTLALSGNTLTSTVNGVAATASVVSGVSNTSGANTLSTTVNGVTGDTVPIINSNILGLSGTSITATINGVASSPLDISSLDNNIYNADGTLTASRTVTMGADNLTLNATTGNLIFNPSSTGYVGIGTTSPQYALEVSSPAVNESRVYIHPSSANGTDYALLQFSNTGGTSYFGMDNSTGLALSSGTPYALTTYAAGSIPISFVAGGSERMRIASGGNVAIGTTASNYRFTVLDPTETDRVAAIKRGTQGSDPSLPTAFGTPYLNIGGLEYLTNSVQTIGFGFSDGTGSYIAPAEIGLVTTTTAGYTTGDLVFGIRSGTTDVAPSELMRIKSNGNVGIGTTNPLSVLHANGTVTLGTPAGGTTPATGTLTFNSSAVASSVSISAGSTSASYSLTLPTAQATAAGQMLTNGGSGVLAWATPSTGTNYWTASGSNITNNNSGSVTATGALITDDYFYNAATGINQIVLNSSGADYGMISNPTAQVWSLGYASSPTVLGTSVLSWTTSGDVGIGTTGPLYPLDVTGAIHATGDIITPSYFYNTATGANQMVLNSIGADYGAISNPSSQVWSLGYTASPTTLGTSVLSWTPGGHVGIGTTAPSASLHVVGGAMFGTTGTSSNTRTLTVLDSGTAQVNFGIYPGAWTSAIQIQDNTTNRFLWISPLDNASANNSRIMAAATGLDIYTNGSISSAGTLTMSLGSNGYTGVGGLTGATYCLQLPNTASVAGEDIAYAHPTYSDERVKSDREPLKYGLETIMQLAPLQYFHHNSTIDSNGIHIKEEGASSFGLLAQETYKLVPEMVNRPKDDSKELWSIDYNKLGPILVRAMQQQQLVIEAQHKEIEQLKQAAASTAVDDRVKRLESESEKLKAQMETLQQIIGSRAER